MVDSGTDKIVFEILEPLMSNKLSTKVKVFNEVLPLLFIEKVYWIWSPRLFCPSLSRSFTTAVFVTSRSNISGIKTTVGSSLFPLAS